MERASKPAAATSGSTAEVTSAISTAEVTTVTSTVVDNPWSALRRHTPARIALGRTGISQPTAPQLAFQLAHAQARDAVHRALDGAMLAEQVSAIGWTPMRLHSAATDRAVYLQRPDLGRRLDDDSRRTLADWRTQHQQAQGEAPRHMLALVLGDGLSALALERQAPPFLEALKAGLPADWSVAPVAIVEQARVAVGDEVGEALGAELVVVLIGERPGLSSPDSMGLYLTWDPKPGRHDAERNCISNVRPEGQPIATAVARLVYLLGEARQRRLTGVDLKDESVHDDGGQLDQGGAHFLIGGPA